MRPQIEIGLAIVLLTLAVVPWMAESCAAPLVPVELAEEPTRYESTAEAARAMTRLADQSAPPKIAVAAVGTLAPELKAEIASAMTLEAATVYTATDSGTLPATPSFATAMSHTAVPLTSVSTNPAVTITALPADTTPTIAASSLPVPTKVVVVVRSGSAHTPTMTAEPISEKPKVVTPNAQRTIAGGFVEDMISPERLAQQVQLDVGGEGLRDLVIQIASEEVHGTGTVDLLGGLEVPLEVYGTLAVEDESLVLHVTMISLDGLDVTSRYKTRLESLVKSALYRLLPQRYVSSFSVNDGQLYVMSVAKP